MTLVTAGLALTGFARHFGRARRHDYGRLEMALSDLGESTFLVVRRRAALQRPRPSQLVEQGSGLQAVIGSLWSARRRRDIPARAVEAFADLPHAK